MCVAQDLVYKGVIKVTYDRGYALQTKSLLVENVTTAAEAVEKLFDALGLRGNPFDYALEEHNLMTGGTKYLTIRAIIIIIMLAINYIKYARVNTFALCAERYKVSAFLPYIFFVIMMLLPISLYHCFLYLNHGRDSFCEQF